MIWLSKQEKTKNMEYFKTFDLPRAAFLVVRGFHCLGSIPDPDDKKGFRRLFVLEYAREDESRFLEAEDDYLQRRDMVSAISFYRAQKTLKHYITDLEIEKGL